MYVQFVNSAVGDEGGGVQLVCEGTCCLAWEIIFDRRRDGSVVFVFIVINTGGSVCGCMCVYTRAHTHTHTASMGSSIVSPGVGKRNLEGPENPDGPNLVIYIYMYMCTNYSCVDVC